jgi:hypothetical protein
MHPEPQTMLLLNTQAHVIVAVVGVHADQHGASQALPSLSGSKISACRDMTRLSMERESTRNVFSSNGIDR